MRDQGPDRIAERRAVLARLDAAGALSRFHLRAGVPRDPFREVLADIVIVYERWRTGRIKTSASIHTMDHPLMLSDLPAARRLAKHGGRGSEGDKDLVETFRRGRLHQDRVATLKQHEKAILRWEGDELNRLLACVYGLWLTLADSGRTGRLELLQHTLPSILATLEVPPKRNRWSGAAIEKRLVRKRWQGSPRTLAYCLLSTDVNLLPHRPTPPRSSEDLLDHAPEEGRAIRGFPL